MYSYLFPSYFHERDMHSITKGPRIKFNVYIVLLSNRLNRNYHTGFSLEFIFQRKCLH